MRLAVNIDHIATIREARKAREPEPVAAALIAELAGAQGITVHLRGDRRHIKDRDVELLRQVVSTKLNIEMAATAEMTGIAGRLRPDQVTLVPEHPREVTTQGGLDVIAGRAPVAEAIAAMRQDGVRVSVFIDPVEAQVAACRELGADAVEINTGGYADADPTTRRARLAEVERAAGEAAACGLEVLAGHGLTYVNVHPVAAIGAIEELNIGHSIIARASLVGLDRAVREMVALLAR
ncbi:MAG TPA: pyridoxine 5'-phosphate synthase [Vicinamibacterales bacterium]|nr:pyridoxine 5'-phosphate synthase [Vicinamibacterales bacterium]